MTAPDVRLVPVRQARQIATCEAHWREYGEWATAEYQRLSGRSVDADHEGFRAELPSLVAGQGRLYLAELDGVAVGTGALKLTNSEFAEIKRMYVRPAARGLGISRVLLRRLIADATDCGYDRVRLDTMVFMHAAQTLYRSMGFVDIGRYQESESARADIADDAVYLELDLQGLGPPLGEGKLP